MLKTFLLFDFTIDFLHNDTAENLKWHPQLMFFSIFSLPAAGLALY